MTNKMLSQKIRSDLKAAGFTSKDYSIRVRNATYSTAVDIEVKNPFVKIREISQIAHQYEKVDIDQYSGEILAGGNTYVHCQYKYGIFDELSKGYLQQAEELFNKAKQTTGNYTFVFAENKECVLGFYDGRIFEIENKTGCCNYRQTPIFLYNAQSLSFWLWKFNTFGTIAD